MIRTKLIGIALCGLFLLGGAGVASAASWPDRDRDRRCEERIEQRRHDLDRAIRDHGYYSRQADHERRELARAESECR
jgi:hypothetical protein